MTVTVQPGERVVFVGDSTSARAPGTAWYDGVSGAPTAGLFVALLNANIAARTAGVAVATGTVASATGTTGARSVAPIVELDSGLSGDTAANLSTVVSSRITSLRPDVVFIAVGVNDVIAGTSANTFATNYASIVTQIKAWNPQVRVIGLYIYAAGEVWSAGPIWGVNSPSYDALIDSCNAKIATAGCDQTINTRAPLLTWEVTNNPGAAATGFATILPDGTHLSPALGKPFVGTTILAAINSP